MSLLAVGTVALDHIETPFASQRNVLGGSATFLALAARFFTDDVRLVAAVGDDFPDAYTAMLRDAGVRLNGLEVQPGGKTFSWTGRYHYDFNSRDTLDTQLNVLETFQPVVPEAFRDARIVCLGNLEPSIQADVLGQMSAPAYTILDTMNFWIEQTPDALAQTLRLVDCLIVNDAEARQLADDPSLIRAASKIRTMGPKTLIIKKGEHGALLFSDDTVFAAPAFPLEDLHDPTGAGDAFMGGFAGYLARCRAVTPHTLRRAVVCGSVVASFSVEAFGPARLLSLTQAELNARTRAYEQLAFIPAEED
ncbi:MAG: sugar kinase [Rhodothermales bacterium]|nr:sugar kinase [Rhodothermales bacterium]